jgi:hypothetical protein
MPRERASREGVPYQTLIASVLHKYVTDQLYDEREIRKTLELIESSGTEESPRRYWCGDTGGTKHFIGFSGVLMMTVGASGSDCLRGYALRASPPYDVKA